MELGFNRVHVMLVSFFCLYKLGHTVHNLILTMGVLFLFASSETKFQFLVILIKMNWFNLYEQTCYLDGREKYKSKVKAFLKLSEMTFFHDATARVKR